MHLCKQWQFSLCIHSWFILCEYNVDLLLFVLFMRDFFPPFCKDFMLLIGLLINPISLHQELLSFCFDEKDYEGLPFDFYGGYIGYIGYVVILFQMIWTLLLLYYLSISTCFKDLHCIVCLEASSFFSLNHWLLHVGAGPLLMYIWCYMSGFFFIVSFLTWSHT